MDLCSSHSFFPKIKILSILARITKNQISNFLPRILLYMKSQVFLKVFVSGCSYQILKCAMLYARPGVRKCVFFIIYSVPKTYSFKYTLTSIPSNKGKKKARNNSTFIATKYAQNVIKLKQNFPNNLFQYQSNFFHLSLGYCKFHSRMLSRHLKAHSFLLMHDIFFER